MSPRPMKKSPAALSSPTVNPRPRRASWSRTAASPRWLGPGATLVRAMGTHAGMQPGRRVRGRAPLRCDLSVSSGDLFGGRCDQGQRRDVRRHGEHAERKCRGSLARTTRTPVVTVCATRRPALAPSQDENENSHADQDQADNDVERRIEVRLGRERDRASEQHDGDDDRECGQDHPGGVAHPCLTTVGAGKEHGLFRQHHRADRSAQAERDDDRERRHHRRDYRVRIGKNHDRGGIPRPRRSGLLRTRGDAAAARAVRSRTSRQRGRGRGRACATARRSGLAGWDRRPAARIRAAGGRAGSRQADCRPAAARHDDRLGAAARVLADRPERRAAADVGRWSRRARACVVRARRRPRRRCGQRVDGEPGAGDPRCQRCGGCAAAVVTGEGLCGRARGVLGVCAGLYFGLAAGFAKPVLQDLNVSVGEAAGDWRTWALLAFGFVGFLLQQLSLATGQLAPAMAAVSVSNPAVSVLLGIALYEERLTRPSWHVAVACAALLAALGGAPF